MTSRGLVWTLASSAGLALVHALAVPMALADDGRWDFTPAVAVSQIYTGDRYLAR